MTVCAFLNQGGGQVLFGVTPGGVVAGQKVSEPSGVIRASWKRDRSVEGGLMGAYSGANGSEIRANYG